MCSIDIGAFGEVRSKQIVESLNGKTFLNFKAIQYPLNGEFVVNLSTDLDVTEEELKNILIFYMATQLVVEKER